MDWLSFFLVGFGPLGFLLATTLSESASLEIEPMFLLVFGLMGFVVGSIIGDRRGRVWMGGALGVSLGVAGWILVAAWPRSVRNGRGAA